MRARLLEGGIILTLVAAAFNLLARERVQPTAELLGVPVTIGGVAPSMSAQDVLRLWGQPKRLPVESGYQSWLYGAPTDRSVVGILDGQVWIVDGPALWQDGKRLLEVGDPESKVKHVLGDDKFASGEMLHRSYYWDYCNLFKKEGLMVTVTFSDDRCVEGFRLSRRCPVERKKGPARGRSLWLSTR